MSIATDFTAKSADYCPKWLDIDESDFDYDIGDDSISDLSSHNDDQICIMVRDDGEVEVFQRATSKEIKGYLESFFKDRLTSAGDEISTKELLTERHIEIVKRLDLDFCITQFMDVLEENNLDEFKRVQLFKSLQAEAFVLGIPKHHSGGILLVYLILCLGLDV